MVFFKLKRLIKIEFLKFLLVGILANLIYYLLYIILTYIGIDIFLATTFLFIITTIFSFKGNAKFTFKVKKTNNKNIISFYLIQLLFYFINIFTLFILVKNMGFAHELIQGILVICLAFFNFLISKKYVFS